MRLCQDRLGVWGSLGNRRCAMAIAGRDEGRCHGLPQQSGRPSTVAWRRTHRGLDDDAAAGSLIENVLARPADQDVVSGIAMQDVVAGAADQDVGTVAAIGVAIGGIGAMIAGILGAFFGLGAWMPIGIIAILLLISGPSLLLAYLKLRQRNLGPILDANGWAINGRARINVPFGAALTDVAALPPGAERSLDDPYAQKEQPWWLYLFLAIVLLLGLAWYLGKLDRALPGAAKSTAVLGTNAPAYKPEPAKPAAVEKK